MFAKLIIGHILNKMAIGASSQIGQGQCHRLVILTGATRVFLEYLNGLGGAKKSKIVTMF